MRLSSTTLSRIVARISFTRVPKSIIVVTRLTIFFKCATALNTGRPSEVE
jgi:hypothetical protein